MSPSSLDTPRPGDAAAAQPIRPWRRAVARLAARWARPHGLLLQADLLWDGGRPPTRLTAALPGSDFDRWCRFHPGHAAAVWLSGHLLQDVVCDPALPVDGDEAVRDHARPLLMHFHGEAAANWPLAAWSAAGHHGASALCHAAASPADLLATARAHGVRVVSVRPWWALCLSRAMTLRPDLAHRDRALLLVIEGTLVTVLTIERGGLVQVARRWLAAPTAESLAGLATAVRSPADTPCLAVGYGLDAASVPGVTAVGLWNRPQPQAQWLHPDEAIA